MTTTPAPRRGLALVAATLALAIVVLVMGAITWRILAQRRQLDQRHHQMQAEWLAQAGLEIAATRLLMGGKPTPEEEFRDLLPDSRVRITIRAEKEQADTFTVTSEAQYPTEAGVGTVTRSLSRRWRRSGAGEPTRLEVP